MIWAGADPHPWVAARRERVTFSVQPVPTAADPQPGATILAAGRLADELGLDGFYMGDHPAHTIDQWMHLAILARETSQVTLGSVVNCIYYRSPMLFARLASDLDHLSAGRLMLGLGIGWHEQEFGELGMQMPPVPKRHAAMEEILAILDGVWGERPFTFTGEQFQVTNAQIAAPIQRPPLMIAGAGERVSFRQVAEYADISNFGASPQIGGVQTPDDVRAKYAVLRQRCAEAGRDYDDILRTWFVSWLMVAPTEAEAEAKLRRYYPDGLTEEQRYSRVVGTPEQVVEYFQAMASAGVQQFVCQVQDAADLETIELLGREVAPIFG